MRSNLKDSKTCRLCGIQTFRQKGFCKDCEAGLGKNKVMTGRKAEHWSRFGYFGKMKRNPHSFPEGNKEENVNG